MRRAASEFSLSRGNITKWLYVGLHIKRWLALLAIAVAIMGIGFAYILREVYVSYTFPVWAFYITLQFIPRWLRGLLFIASALSLAIFSGWQLNRSLAHALLPSGDRQRDLRFHPHAQLSPPLRRHAPLLHRPFERSRLLRRVVQRSRHVPS